MHQTLILGFFFFLLFLSSLQLVLQYTGRPTQRAWAWVGTQ